MDIVIRSLILFVVLFLVIKILGKKQIKSLTLYDYILSITIGSIAADCIINVSTPLLDGIIALTVFGIIGFLISIFSYNSHMVEEILDGEPLILYENDDFNYSNLAKAKLSVAKVLENCRLNGCFDISELDVAILESSGDISILLKGSAQPLTSNDLKKDLQKNSKKQTLNYLIIVDGKINLNELTRANKTKDWLNHYLKNNELNLEKISLLCIDKKGKINLYNKK